MKLNKKEISDYVQKFLKEDKSNDDITSKYFIGKKQKARAYFLTEENIVLAGNNIVFYIFETKMCYSRCSGCFFRQGAACPANFLY